MIPIGGQIKELQREAGTEIWVLSYCGYDQRTIAANLDMSDQDVSRLKKRFRPDTILNQE